MRDEAHEEGREFSFESFSHLTDSFVCDDEEGIGKFLESSDLTPDKFVFYVIFDQDNQRKRIYGEAKVGFEKES